MSIHLGKIFVSALWKHLGDSVYFFLQNIKKQFNLRKGRQ